MDNSLFIQLFAALLSVLGFALFFNIKKHEILMLTVGGLATWFVYLGVDAMFKGGAFVPTLVASIFGAIYALAMGYRYKAPASTFFFVSVITLVPGRTLYFTMYNAAIGDWNQFVAYGIATLAVVSAIAIGMTVVWLANEFWRHRKDVPQV